MPYFVSLLLSIVVMVVFAAVSNNLGLAWSESVQALLLALVFLSFYLIGEYSLKRRRVIPRTSTHIALVGLIFGAIGLGLFLSLLNTAGPCIINSVSTDCIKLSGFNERVILAVVAAPLFEELVLRGYLRRFLRKVMVPEVVVAIFTAIIFTLAHSKLAMSPSFGIYFSVSMLLSALAFLVDGILLSVLFHSAWNAVAVVVVGENFSYLTSPISWISLPDLVKIGLSIAMVAISVLIFYQGRKGLGGAQVG